MEGGRGRQDWRLRCAWVQVFRLKAARGRHGSPTGGTGHRHHTRRIAEFSDQVLAGGRAGERRTIWPLGGSVWWVAISQPDTHR